jgi:hypothetical protein
MAVSAIEKMDILQKQAKKIAKGYGYRKRNVL